MIAPLLRALGQLLLIGAARLDAWQNRDTRTDDQIRANPRPGDWWHCSCGLAVPVLGDLETHRARGECPDLSYPWRCPYCDRGFATREDRRDHQLDEHGAARCSFCNVEFDASTFDAHAEVCDEIPF